ncbi:long-chain-fatty-acid--CoA ligase 1a isoform X8 [Phyllopteryx taeniolatus]|uniref:long-chain-fatty-acid--CoA ligase 1a isoform X8 n=1 Tax=Phyllopteryx taeniolatus TaxID=161469 RepID=UPI002AD48E22|nr:long-chain-fatty-acid--CoA ligase 1a isoform X8 [Phyllopteryx taeniolatus]
MRSIACSTAMQGQEVLRQLRLPELDDLRQYIRGLPTNTLLGMGAIAAFTTYWLSTRPRALEPPCDLTMQSVDMLGEEGARRSALNKSDEHMTYYHSDAKTIYEAFLRGLRVSNNGPCLGARKPNRPYEWQSYREVADRAENVGSALLHKGHAQSGDKFIGIFAQNRPEWTISELACYTYSLVAVPLYDTLGAEAISYIIDKVSISTVICDVPEKARMILDCFAEKERTVKTIVVMEPFDGELVARGQTCGVEVLSLKEFEDLGKANYRDPMPPKAEDLALICFTSGTTGNPKGAVLTHGNIIANTAAFLKITEVHCMLDCRDVLVSYLPLAHMLERVVQFYEGYGQTECTAGCSMSMPGDWTAGHVGPPLPCNAIKLVDVVDMNYLAANNEGEVCVKGPNVFLGYLGNPEKTAEAIDKDGWLHTGDIGKWLPNGTLKIIDRKKHIFKLAQGEYIAPEKIENIYNRSDPVAQIFVHGDSLQACLVGIVVPDPDFLPIWIKKRGINGSYLDMCKSNDVKNAILEDIQKLGKEAGLKSFEQVRDIALHPEMFSVQNGLLTPTLKAKRAELLSHFRAQIDELYAGVKV